MSSSGVVQASVAWEAVLVVSRSVTCSVAWEAVLGSSRSLTWRLGLPGSGLPLQSREGGCPGITSRPNCDDGIQLGPRIRRAIVESVGNTGGDRNTVDRRATVSALAKS